MTNVLDYQSPETREVNPPLLMWSRVGLSLLAIVIPIACFVMVAIAGFPLTPRSQQEVSHGYLLLIPNRAVTWVFYPFLIYSMASAACFLSSPLRFANSFIVRFGLYSGIVLAAQFSIIHLAIADFAAKSISIALAFAVSPLVLGGILLAIPRLWRDKVIFSIGGFGLAVLALWFALRPQIIVALYLLGAVAPMLTLGAYGILSLVALRIADPASSPARQRRWILPTGWVAAYGAAWAGAMKLAADEFAKLPVTQPSGCYIATAAARGHRAIVRSHLQLWRLKALELFIKALSREMHAKLRRAYDRLDRQFAEYIDDAFGADLAYFLLKPFEWATVAMLLFSPPMRAQIARKLSEDSPL